MGSVVLPHLNSGWHVDQAILSGSSLSFAVAHHICFFLQGCSAHDPNYTAVQLSADLVS